MNELRLQIKLDFVFGLKEIVLNELSQCRDFRIIKKDEKSVYIDFIKDFTKIIYLRSISHAYLVARSLKYNPFYISKHKLVLGALIELTMNNNENSFKSFKITCAGSNSPEVQSIAEYIQKTYRLIEKEESDMKIYIIKLDKTWEIGIQITPRPLSVRDYKVKNMRGAMDPTIAYAMNSLCELGEASSYLNVFSGSATLLIEAGQCYPNLKQLVGFDNNKKNISLAIQNIKEAGLIKKIQLKEEDIFDKPDLGKFDVIASDLPFGMSVSKNENIGNLYECFIEYCQKTLNYKGKLVVYTSEYEILEKIISKSNFKVIKTLNLKFVTSVNSYLRPKIFVCKLKA